MDELVKKLPKIELHAHLSGSISRSTLIRLLNESCNITNNLPIIGEGSTRHISECFDLFQLIHEVVNDSRKVEQVTMEVVEEFAADGVMYLELRTTLRPLPTCEDYLHAVIRGLKSSHSVRTGHLVTGLLISIDRAHGFNKARETVTLAIEAARSWPQLVVGVDLSGNPQVGSLLDYAPLLNEARANGLKTTVHLAEVPNQAHEWLAFLRQHLPDRLGHVTYLPHSDKDCIDLDAIQARTIVMRTGIPLEICLTSNVRTRTVTDYPSHHFGRWFQLGQPLCLCTDDKGMFCSDLSNEFHLAAQHFGLMEEDIFRLCHDAIRAAFCSDKTKSQLREKLLAFRQQMRHGQVR